MTTEQFLAQVLDLVQNKGQPEETFQHILHYACAHRKNQLSEMLIEQHGAIIQSGPFAGMKYLATSPGSFLPPKLLGCYEAELHGIISQIARTSYDRIINIGCGEGYYAVGFARLLPKAWVYAFDIDPKAQSLCRQLAELNGVIDRITVAGECHPNDLGRHIAERTLIFCDCEGAEQALLDPEVVPPLCSCDLVVELHEFMQESSVILNRFQPTHSIIRINHGMRDPNSFSAIKSFNQLDQLLAVWEGRPGPTPWVFLRPHIQV